jgi:long-subunit acyl-CoA synthetase (AMP-forming)
MTESCTVVCSTPYNDIDFGSSGCLLPSYKARIISEDGTEIKELEQAGELLVQSPTVVLGYLNNPKANEETFVDGWLRTGDKALIRKSPNGNEHVWIVDRVKELIKVKVCNSFGHAILTLPRDFK